MYVEETNRLRAISLTILGSISQLSITMIMGTLGLFLLKNGFLADPQKFSSVLWLLSDTLFYSSVAVTVILLMLFFRVNFLIDLISRVPLLKSMVKFIAVVEIFSGKQLLRILFLSFLRYIVFILQYMLLLSVMEVDIAYPVSFLLLICHPFPPMRGNALARNPKLKFTCL